MIFLNRFSDVQGQSFQKYFKIFWGEKMPFLYIAQKYDQRGGVLLPFAVLEGFLLFDIILSDQKVFGSCYKNIHKKLRVYTKV